MSFHFTTWQLPSAILSSASVRSALLASGDCALWWGPFCIAASICAIIQSCPQSRGEPSDAYWSSTFDAYWGSTSAAGWHKTLLRGCIRLLVLCDLLCVAVSGGRVGCGMGIGDGLILTILKITIKITVMIWITLNMRVAMNYSRLQWSGKIWFGSDPSDYFPSCR